jgi:hypothetical protein
MHYGHDHYDHGTPGIGHNQSPEPQPALQWQTPHRDGAPAPEHDHGEPDLDLVETAFVDAFGTAADPTSFLRLARVPFDKVMADGTRLVLLRVAIDAVTDVGGIMPHLGGTSFRYDPLPAKITSRRRRLRFVYFDGNDLRPLNLGEVRALDSESEELGAKAKARTGIGP